MDEAGWHALRRAEAAYHEPYERNPDGSYQPIVNVNPLNEPYITGPSRSTSEASTGSWGPPPGPPPGHQERPPAYHAPANHAESWMPNEEKRVYEEKLNPTPSAIERCECGPLLRYDTVENDTYYGSVLIVTADAGSIYSPHPRLTLEWDPERPSYLRSSSTSSQYYAPGSTPMGDPSHPAAAYGGTSYSRTSLQSTDSYTPSARARTSLIKAQEIWVYHGPYGSCTFWRMMFEIPLSENEMAITYRVNGGHGLQFFVPGKTQNMRWAAYSCNGFSAGINADEFRGPGHASGFDPVWSDLLDQHAEKPFHVLVGGGDQLYCDSLMREPEFQEFINLTSRKAKLAYQITDSIRAAIDRFYFSHYCLVFRNGKFAQANSTIPMVNMLDDHDMIDGFGSYPEELQRSPMFQLIGDRAYHFFLLFQCFVVDAVDGIDSRPGKHSTHSMLIGGAGAWIPYPSHSFLTYMGPATAMIMLDCRAERRLDRVCSETTYRRMFDRLWELPASVKHLVVQLGIPIAYPRMNFLETALESSFNPFIALGKKACISLRSPHVLIYIQGQLGMGSLVNKFNKDAELLDDLMDHWTAAKHKKERNWFVEQMQNFALLRRIRVTFLSGDVHCAAVGVFKTLSPNAPVDPRMDYRYMINVVTSAIVNTPPPNGVQTMVASLSDKQHKSMHYAQTDETMIPLFQKDTNGKPPKSKNIMGRRNYAIVEYDSKTEELQFDIRVEKQKGVGTTVGYPIRTPGPGWQVP
ncbi:SubName: Full=Uncharacterized protein {ECO:0000313/EMBL:CCA69829.1} [Serendipita indica DSM 11827]|nr:SubName: Full=Uncharacterized protein {ECO:0000313/EMBL:CCA69829.1} [Serendipita indica DSM 11827]